MLQADIPRIHRINISTGGVPKVPVAEAVVGYLGIQGDQQRHLRYHGGPQRALCFFAFEIIERLQHEGHPIIPGSAGENITTIGLDWELLEIGARLRLGDEVELEITGYTTPCKNIAKSFIDGEFTRVSQKLHPGQSRLYARIINEGRIRMGDAITLI